MRELHNLLERTALLCDSEAIEVSRVHEALATGRRLPASPLAARPTAGAGPRLRELEREALRNLVAHHQGSRAELACQLGISERSLYRKLKSLT